MVSEAIEDPKVCCIGSVGENPCGFWGQDNYFTQLTFFLKKRQVFNCIQLSISLFWDAIQKAAEFSQIIPCTNVPIHCPLFPTAVSGNPPTIWQYNPLYHLTSEHSSGSTPPSIPGQLLVQMFITKRIKELWVF